MSDNPRATKGSSANEPPEKLRQRGDDELIQQLTSAFRSREALQPDASLVAARLEAELAKLPGGGAQGARDRGQASPVTTLVRRGGKIVVAGVLTSVLAAAATGAAAAANPYSEVARSAEKMAQTLGIEWSAMPKGYTRDQYEAFWGAGYTAENVETLGDLWKLDPVETKARAGQMVLDGRTPPVKPGEPAARASGSNPSPGSATGTQAEYDAFWSAGYTGENLATLSELWKTDSLETKARAGRLILEGKTLPVAPSGHR